MYFRLFSVLLRFVPSQKYYSFTIITKWDVINRNELYIQQNFIVIIKHNSKLHENILTSLFHFSKTACEKWGGFSILKQLSFVLYFEVISAVIGENIEVTFLHSQLRVLFMLDKPPIDRSMIYISGFLNLV